MCYHFHEGLYTTETARRICEVYGPERMIQKWFERFRVGNFSVKHAERSDRPRTVDTDKIITLVDANPHPTVRKFQENLVMSHGSIVARLRDADSKMDVGAARIECQEPAATLECKLLEKNKEHPFFVTRDEK